MTVQHAQSAGFAIHVFHEVVHTARVSAPQGCGSAIFGGHKRQQDHFAPAQGGSVLQTGAGQTDQVAIFLADGDCFFQIQAGIQNYHRSHQLGDRSNGSDGVDVLAVNDIALLVEHDRRGGFQAGIAFQSCEF